MNFHVSEENICIVLEKKVTKHLSIEKLALFRLMLI